MTVRFSSTDIHVPSAVVGLGWPARTDEPSAGLGWPVGRDRPTDPTDPEEQS